MGCEAVGEDRGWEEDWGFWLGGWGREGWGVGFWGCSIPKVTLNWGSKNV